MEHAVDVKTKKTEPIAGGAKSEPSFNAESSLHPVLRLQRQIGNQAVLRLLSRATPAIQPKLTLNEPGD